jgi:hypothetical protein
MKATRCEEIKESVFKYLQEETHILSTPRVCILSLPIRVLDGARAEVFIEEINNGAFLIHDAGKTVGHLESSGLLMSDSRSAVLESLAVRLGVSFDDGVFKTIAKQANIQESALAIGQCCSMALFDLLRHTAASEEIEIRARVGREVHGWSKASGILVKNNVKVSGRVRQYKIDFLAEAASPIEISVLIPSYSAMVSAERYGLQVLDLQSRGGHNARRLAVLAKSEKWTRPARKIVTKLANGVAEISTGESLFGSNIPDALSELAKAA